MLSLFSCSLDSVNSLSGVTATVTSKSQTIFNSNTHAIYLSERLIVINRIESEHSANVSLLNRNLIGIDEFRSRSLILNNTKISELTAINEKYMATTGIWSPLEADISINCNNPSSTNVAIEIEVIYHGGSKDTLQGYPDPLLKGQSYCETVSFRTGNYVDTVKSVRVINI
jgi:hypothetical protein